MRHTSPPRMSAAFSVLLLFCLALLLTSGVVAQQAKTPAPVTPPAPPKAAASPAGGSTYRLVGTIKDLMEGIIDPASDILFDAVATDITAAGIKEKRPENDEEWAVVEHNALMLAEAANLLKMPGRQVARPGENTRSEGPDAPELTAPQIAAKIAANRALWLKYATGLQTAAQKSLAAARKKDTMALFDTGEDIDMACENCHLEYWYPNEKVPK